MDNQTFRSRVEGLIIKSRKALRLYSTSHRSSGDYRGENHAEAQVKEWRGATSLLLKGLSEALKTQPAKNMVQEVFRLRELFHNEWRCAETDMRTRQKELLSAAEAGDFIRCATNSIDLIALKARTQATQAAHHEIEELLRRSKVVSPIELSNDHMLAEAARAVGAQLSTSNGAPVEHAPRMAKIIPLRKSGSEK